MEPLRGKTSSFAVSTQGCEYATLGFEIEPLRGKPDRSADACPKNRSRRFPSGSKTGTPTPPLTRADETSGEST